MSTDHAPGDADDAHGIVTPAQAGQCVSGSGSDVVRRTGTSLGGEKSPTSCMEAVAPTTDITPSTQNLKYGEVQAHGSYDIALQSAGSDQDDTLQPLKRQSLHLRMASLSPTLAASPGAKLLRCMSWDVHV